MIQRLLTLLTLSGAAFLSAAAQMPCGTVTGAQIFGADLARELPVFHTIPPDLPLAPSPLPGASRVFPVTELQTLATRFAIPETVFADVCFRIATESLDRKRLVEAMMEALPIPGVRVGLLETSSESIPIGRIEFRRENLGTPAALYRSLPVIWRGDVIYAGDRRFAIWARVTVAAPVKRLIAVETLRSGQPVKPGQVREETGDAFPLPSSSETSLSRIEGLIPVRAISAGAEIRAEDVRRPNEVNRGDLVRVEVRLGAARLALTGRAESGGHSGDWVPVRNLESSRIFQAQVEGTGSVSVKLPASEESLK